MKVLRNTPDAEALVAPKMPDYLGADQRKTKEDEKDDKPIRGERTRAGAPSREGPAPAPQRRGIPAAIEPEW